MTAKTGFAVFWHFHRRTREYGVRYEGTEKPASNACVYTNRRNRRFPLSRKPALQCLSVLCPKPRKSQQCVIWNAG